MIKNIFFVEIAQRRGLSVAGILHALENTLVDGEDEDDGLEFPQVDTWKKIMGLRWTVFNTSCHFPTSKASFEYLHQCFGSVFFPRIRIRVRIRILPKIRIQSGKIRIQIREKNVLKLELK